MYDEVNLDMGFENFGRRVRLEESTVTTPDIFGYLSYVLVSIMCVPMVLVDPDVPSASPLNDEGQSISNEC